MYITYASRPLHLPLVSLVEPKKLPAVGDFRPTWLIRVSDMAKVPGHVAKEGYCTLSYAWIQSGDIIPTEGGEYTAVDQGKHVLIAKAKNSRRRPRHRPQRKLVKFERLLQQLCHDFGIKYIWYDKICINQLNREEKLHEIKQMHHIYHYARFVVALVPELQTMPLDYPLESFDGKDDRAFFSYMLAIKYSEWSQRMWTLEEAMMARSIVFVGRDMHIWSDAISSDSKQFPGALEYLAPYIEDIFKRTSDKRSANSVLRHAHTRISSKKHDEFFALINIFHNVLDIEISYKRDVCELASEFYSKLAAADLSVLCFGQLDDGQSENKRSKDYQILPSWTGVVIGDPLTIHAHGNFTATFKSYSVTNTAQLSLHNCQYISLNRSFTDDKQPGTYFQHFITGTNEDLGLTNNFCVYENESETGWKMSLTSTGCDPNSRHCGPYEFCKHKNHGQCWILAIPFTSKETPYTLYPVVTRLPDRDAYTSIGICYDEQRLGKHKNLEHLSQVRTTSLIIE